MHSNTKPALRRTRHGLAALVTAAMLALTGAGCGDDKEGPAEDVGKAIDKGGKKLGGEAKEAERDLDDGKKD